MAHDPRYTNTVHAFVNYFSYTAYQCSGGMEIEADYVSQVHPESRGVGHGITRTDYRPEPGLSDMHLAFCSKLSRIKSNVGLHRWVIIYSLCHPESEYFAQLRPGCFTGQEGQTDYFHPAFQKYDHAQRWAKGWAERLFNSGIWAASDVLFPKKKAPPKEGEAVSSS